MSQEILIGQIWKSKYDNITYKIYGGGKKGCFEACDVNNIWKCKNISKKDLIKHFELKNKIS